MKITSIDHVPLYQPDKEKIVSCGEFSEYGDTPDTKEEILQRAGDAEVIISSSVQFDRDLLLSLSNVKLICITSAGYDRIDVQAATDYGILVAHCPGHNMNAVAEYTIGLMIAASRLMFRSATDVRAGRYDQYQYLGKELCGKTLGVIGYGTIGKKLAEMAQRAFDMRILTYDIGNTQEELYMLLEQSDYITLHLALNSETRGILNSETLKHVKDGSILINAARGGLVDEQALYEVLKEGRLFAAALDVTENEPFDLDNPLFSLKNVIITPHTAWNTSETKIRWSAQIAEIVQGYSTGSPTYIVREQQKLQKSLLV